MTDMIYGIDLGTTNSAIAYTYLGRHGAEVSLISNLDESDLTPSVVYFCQNGNHIVGQNALERYVSEPDRTCMRVKREMGRNVTWTISAIPKDVQVTPPMVSACILSYLTESAARKLELDLPPSRAVITVPAYFGDSQRQDTLDAARIAGIQATLLEEPTAALLDYVYQFSRIDRLGAVLPTGAAHVVVFDLGGGTLDISVCEVELLSSAMPSIKVIATDGDPKLGGTDFDIAMARLAIRKAMSGGPRGSHLGPLLDAMDEFESEGVVKDPQMAEVLAQHLTKAEIAKKRLSVDDHRTFPIPRVTGRVVDVEITREEFERELEPLLEKMGQAMDRALVRASEASGGRIASWGSVARCVLVGGATQTPAVRRLVDRLFGDAVTCAADRDRAVARGAAIKSALDSGVLMLGDLGFATTHDYGILNGAGDMESVIIPKGSEYPAEYSQSFHLPFSLDAGFPFNIGQRYMNGCASIGVKSFHHPFMYTGDELTVSLSIDADGLLHFRASDPQTGESLDEVISSQTGMTDQQIVDARASLRQMQGREGSV